MNNLDDIALDHSDEKFMEMYKENDFIDLNCTPINALKYIKKILKIILCHIVTVC